MLVNQLELFARKKCLLKDNCRYCNNTHGYIYPSDTIHAGYIKCSECSKHHKWISIENFELAKSRNLVNEL